MTLTPLTTQNGTVLVIPAYASDPYYVKEINTLMENHRYNTKLSQPWVERPKRKK